MPINRPHYLNAQTGLTQQSSTELRQRLLQYQSSRDLNLLVRRVNDIVENLIAHNSLLPHYLDLTPSDRGA